MGFEWDPRKAEENYRKHGVSFDEATEAFIDENAVELYDAAHSDQEYRYLILGISRSRLLFVGYTMRDEIIRIITARKANASKRGITMSKNRKLADYIVTEEDYQADLASGLTEDEVMKPGVYKARRSPWAERLKNAKKVKVSIYLDGDVVTYFRERAEQPNAAPYQTQINNELRKIMESGSADAQTLEKAMLNDKKFLKALKEKLEAV